MPSKTKEASQRKKSNFLFFIFPSTINAGKIVKTYLGIEENVPVSVGIKYAKNP